MNSGHQKKRKLLDSPEVKHEIEDVQLDRQPTDEEEDYGMAGPGPSTAESRRKRRELPSSACGGAGASDEDVDSQLSAPTSKKRRTVSREGKAAPDDAQSESDQMLDNSKVPERTEEPGLDLVLNSDLRH